MNIGILVVGRLNQLFIRGSYTEIEFPKNKKVSGKTPFLVIGPFYTLHYICLEIS